MKTVIISLCIICFLQLTVSAQSTSLFVDSLKIRPGNPSENDSIIFIAYTVHTYTGDGFYDKKVFTTDTVINIYSCWVAGQLPMGYNRNDTTLLGKLTSGNYRIRFIQKYLFPEELDSVEPCLTNPYYDSTFLNFTVSPATAVNNLLDENSFYLFPNPVSNRLHFIGTSSERCSYKILSTDGRMLMQNTMSTLPNFEIDVSTLPAGLYFLELQNDKQRVVKKFVKQ